MRFVVAFGRFWWALIGGDEWRFAGFGGLAAGGGALPASGKRPGGEVIAVAVAVWVMLAVATVILASGRRRAASQR